MKSSRFGGERGHRYGGDPPESCFQGCFTVTAAPHGSGNGGAALWQIPSANSRFKTRKHPKVRHSAAPHSWKMAELARSGGDWATRRIPQVPVCREGR